MQKRFLFVVLPILLLACNVLFPVARQDGNPSPVSPGPASTQTVLSTPQSSTRSTAEFIVIRINKGNGSLMSQLASEAGKAKELGLSPFIEFDATWCPPCQAIEKNIQTKDQLTMQALKGIYLIRADVDEWEVENGKVFQFDVIPIYYQLDENGNPTGAVIDGGAWGEDIPENFAPVLDEFFHAQ